MSIESAIKYMERMRNDPEFRKKINETEDREENWKLLQAEGFDFTVEEFKEAQKAEYEKHGTDQLPVKN